MSTIAHKEELPPGLAFLGNSMLFLGLSILALSFIGTEWLPFEMPRSWYSSPSIWKLLALGLSGGGVAVLHKVSKVEMKKQLRQQPIVQDADWMPEEPGQRFESLTVYTKHDCPLCEEAVDILEDYAAYLPAWEMIDIFSDPALVEKFGTCVPVVLIDGKIRFRGRINEVLLRRMIVASPVTQAVKKKCGCNKQGCGCQRKNQDAAATGESSGCGGQCRCA